MLEARGERREKIARFFFPFPTSRFSFPIYRRHDNNGKAVERT